MSKARLRIHMRPNRTGMPTCQEPLFRSCHFFVFTIPGTFLSFCFSIVYGIFLTSTLNRHFATGKMDRRELGSCVQKIFAQYSHLEDELANRKSTHWNSLELQELNLGFWSVRLVLLYHIPIILSPELFFMLN